MNGGKSEAYKKIFINKDFLMKKICLLIPLCISLSISGAEKKLVPTQQEPFNVWKDRSAQTKEDFLKEKIIALTDAIQEHKKNDAQNATLMKSYRDYIDLTHATMIKLNSTAQESKVQIDEHQTKINLLQEKITTLTATVEKQKTTIEQLKSQQPAATHTESQDKLKRRFSM